VLSNTTVPLTIKGNGLTGVSTITINGPGFNVSNISATNTQVTCMVQVAATTATGPYALTVSGPNGTSNYLFLQVIQQVPSITSLMPPAQPPCTSFPITIAGTNLADTTGIIITPATTGITASITSVSASQVTANISISQSAALGQYLIGVTGVE